jgi:hypothetical protein
MNIQLTPEELLEAAMDMALELRLKDTIIGRLQARVADLEAKENESTP